MTTALDDAAYLQLIVWDEAQGEPDDGKAAVARVVMNRARMRYSDPSGTIAGAVLQHDQFSGLWFDMVPARQVTVAGKLVTLPPHYERVCNTVADAQAKAANLLKLAEQNRTVWADCASVADLVRAGKYAGGAEYQKLTADTVLYLNPAVVVTPAWAVPTKLVCRIGAHVFYRA